LDNPKGCDPSASSQCFFTSAILTNISLTVELSGNSTGYIALAAGLTSNITQVCKTHFTTNTLQCLCGPYYLKAKTITCFDQIHKIESRFGAQETLIIIINVETVFAA